MARPHQSRFVGLAADIVVGKMVVAGNVLDDHFDGHAGRLAFRYNGSNGGLRRCKRRFFVIKHVVRFYLIDGAFQFSDVGMQFFGDEFHNDIAEIQTERYGFFLEQGD